MWVFGCTEISAFIWNVKKETMWNSSFIDSIDFMSQGLYFRINIGRMICCRTSMSSLLMYNHPSYIWLIYSCLKLCFFSYYQNPHIVDLNWNALRHEAKPVVNEYFIGATSAEQILLSSSQMPFFALSAGRVAYNTKIIWNSNFAKSDSFVPPILIA